MVPVDGVEPKRSLCSEIQVRTCSERGSYMKSNASWVMVIWDPICGQKD